MSLAAALHKKSLAWSEAHGYTNSEPGAVATGSSTQLKIPGAVKGLSKRSPAEFTTRSLPCPVRYLSTHGEQMFRSLV